MAAEIGRDRAGSSGAGGSAEPGASRAAASGPEPTPVLAWSRRVRWVGGMIQAAFAVFWLLRGAGAIGGRGEPADGAVGARGRCRVRVRGQGDGGDGPRPRSSEDRRIEREVTVATLIEFAAAIILPVLVTAAGHSDWVLPSIAITIGPLLLWLDHRLFVPRYRAVGWALSIGPLVLVACVRYRADRYHRHRGRVLLLGTAAAGFRELAAVRPAEPRGRCPTTLAAPSYERRAPPCGLRRRPGRAHAERTSAAERGLAVRVLSRSRPQRSPRASNGARLTPASPRLGRRCRRGVGRLPVPERPIHRLARALSRPTARR